MGLIGVDVAALSGADVHWTPSAHIGRTDFRLISSQSCFYVGSKLLCRDLLNSEGLIDLLSTASGKQTGRCVSLTHPLKMATDYEIIVQAIISLL